MSVGGSVSSGAPKELSVGRGGRLAILGVLLGVAVGLVVFTVMAFLRSSPPTVDFTVGHQPGAPVDLTVQTVGCHRLRCPPRVGCRISSRTRAGSGSTPPCGTFPPTPGST